MGKHNILVAVLAVLGAVLSMAPPSSAADEPTVVVTGDDWSVPVVAGDPGLWGTQDLFDGDATGLIPKRAFVQRYSLDQDHWEVWLCGAGVTISMPDAIAALENGVVDYFDATSHGAYEPVFLVGGVNSDSNCLDGFQGGAYDVVGSPEGILIIDDITSGGYASPGSICVDQAADCPSMPSTFPGNGRYAVLGQGAVSTWPSVVAHELGHALQWPHSNSGTGDEYDNWIDLMSGNRTTGGSTEPLPYGTLSYNRLQSGWVADGDVEVASGGSQTVALKTFDAPGTQVLAVPTDQPGRFFVLGARISSTFDPIPASWEGVEVYEVDYYCATPAFGGGICPGLFREHTQQPPSPLGTGHVLQVGESIELEALTIAVTAESATGFTVTIDPVGGNATVPGAPGRPSVAPGDGEAMVTWDAAADGGSPISNYELEVENRASGAVVRFDVGTARARTVDNLVNGAGHRARVRATNALGDGAWSAWSADFTPVESASPGGPPAGGADTFSDDDDSVFEADIEWLAASGITRGCNPPANDLFCPNQSVTRGQMAAFMVRALDLTDRLSDPFRDDNGSVFEADIEKLAASGVTLGCNPPVNDRFCPNDVVTRGQMAAFLTRAFGYTDDDGGDLFVDDDSSVFERDIDRLATAGVTLGCNPPANDRFCPGNAVTRGQMAAFLRRALG